MEDKYINKGLTIIIAVCVAGLLLWGACFAAYINGKTYADKQTTEETTTGNYYACTTIVVEVDRDNDLVTAEDSTGHCWQFYGTEDWQEGDCASLLMWDNGTDTILDDEIQSARYSAWTLTH